MRKEEFQAASEELAVIADPSWQRSYESFQSENPAPENVIEWANSFAAMEYFVLAQQGDGKEEFIQDLSTPFFNDSSSSDSAPTVLDDSGEWRKYVESPLCVTLFYKDSASLKDVRDSIYIIHYHIKCKERDAQEAAFLCWSKTLLSAHQSTMQRAIVVSTLTTSDGPLVDVHLDTTEASGQDAMDVDLEVASSSPRPSGLYCIPLEYIATENKKRSAAAMSSDQDAVSSSSSSSDSNPAKRTRARKPLALMQSECKDCKKFPRGIGCTQKIHKSPQQIANIEAGKVFGYNFLRNGSSTPCKLCIKHGYFCIKHLDQDPTSVLQKQPERLGRFRCQQPNMQQNFSWNPFTPPTWTPATMFYNNQQNSNNTHGGNFNSGNTSNVSNSSHGNGSFNTFFNVFQFGK